MLTGTPRLLTLPLYAKSPMLKVTRYVTIGTDFSN